MPEFESVGARPIEYASDSATKQHTNTIGQRHDLVEFCRYEEHGDASVT